MKQGGGRRRDKSPDCAWPHCDRGTRAAAQAPAPPRGDHSGRALGLAPGARREQPANSSPSMQIGRQLQLLRSGTSCRPALASGTQPGACRGRRAGRARRRLCAAAAAGALHRTPGPGSGVPRPLGHAPAPSHRLAARPPPPRRPPPPPASRRCSGGGTRAHAQPGGRLPAGGDPRGLDGSPDVPEVAGPPGGWRGWPAGLLGAGRASGSGQLPAVGGVPSQIARPPACPAVPDASRQPIHRALNMSGGAWARPRNLQCTAGAAGGRV
jgi:hypothetical protein